MTTAQAKAQLEELGYEFCKTADAWRCLDKDTGEQIAVDQRLGDCVWDAVDALGGL